MPANSRGDLIGFKGLKQNASGKTYTCQHEGTTDRPVTKPQCTSAGNIDNSVG